MKRFAIVVVVGLSFVLADSTIGFSQVGVFRSAGETEFPNGMYSVTDKSAPDYEPPHDSRVKHPYKALIPKLSPVVPAHIRPHSRLVLTDIEDRPFFDYFAWQTFVALVWPADDQRGVPLGDIPPEAFAEFNSIAEDTRYPVVWETFRNVDDVLPNPPADGPPPAHPDAWDAVPYKRPFDLDLFAKGQHPTEIDEAFSPPLVDQNRQYVRYNVQINKVMYEYIRHNKWYLKGNLPKAPTPATLPPLPIPEGHDPKELVTLVQQPQTNTTVTQVVNGNSIEVKSAWRIMITDKDLDPAKPWRQVDDQSRYFVAKANVADPVTGEQSVRDVGLVGLHIVVKTPQFTQGIWSTFEHVDNLTAPGDIRPSFHNKTDKFHPRGFSYKPKMITSKSKGNEGQAAIPEKDRVPVEVSRIYKIPDTPELPFVDRNAYPHLPHGVHTQGLNKAYQALLEGTVWQNYQLVITQWPTDPTSFYAKPYFYPRGFPPHSEDKLLYQPRAVVEAYQRAEANAKAAYPRWAGLPIPQSGSLNVTMETYFQDPTLPLEPSSCMGCHYGASDTDFSWALKLRTWPQPFNQGRVNPIDSQRAARPANTGAR